MYAFSHTSDGEPVEIDADNAFCPRFITNCCEIAKSLDYIQQLMMETWSTWQAKDKNTVN